MERVGAVSYTHLDVYKRQLVLFKLHPLPGGRVRSPGDQNLQVPLPGDKFDIPVE